MTNFNPFAMSTLLDALQEFRLFTASETMNEEPPVIPPPRGSGSLFFSGFYTTFIPQELDMCLLGTFDLMTNSREDVAQYFTDMISEFDVSELQRMASFLTSDSDYFMAIASNNYGSKRLQQLLGKSDDVDTFFAEAINRLFMEVMIDKHASYVAIQGMRVFERGKKESIYYQILIHALDLARDQHGCIALNEIITDLDDPYHRNPLLEIVAHNALELSNHIYGNVVVQHVLKLKDWRCRHSIAANLRGQFVDLSFEKYGSYIVERLLEAEDCVMEEVIWELMACKKDRFMRLAMSEYGNIVVSKALTFMDDILTVDLYMGLVRKLMPSRDLLRSSHGSNIAAILDSFHHCNVV